MEEDERDQGIELPLVYQHDLREMGGHGFSTKKARYPFKLGKEASTPLSLDMRIDTKPKKEIAAEDGSYKLRYRQ